LDGCLEPAEKGRYSASLSDALAQLRAYGVPAAANAITTLSEGNRTMRHFLTHNCVMALYDRAWAALAGGLGLRENEMAGLLRSDYNNDPEIVRAHFEEMGLKMPQKGWAVVYVERQRDDEDTKTESGRRTISVPPI